MSTPSATLDGHPRPPHSSKEDATSAMATAAATGGGAHCRPAHYHLQPGSTVQAAGGAPLHDDGDEGKATPDPPSTPQAHSWGHTTASTFQVRAANYTGAKRKESSASEFYSLVSFDLVKSPEGCVDHVARYMDLAALHPIRTYPGFPSLFVVNTQLPDGEPSMFNSAKDEDGPCRSAIFVFALKASTVELLKAQDTKPLPPALQLLSEYFRTAPRDDGMKGRFKVIASCRNLEALELPSFISNYNAKPVLITKSGRIYQGPGGVMELDIRVHRFAFLAKKGLRFLQGTFASMVLDVAFLVEGRGEEELPEQLLGVARLNHLDYAKAAEGIFDGLGKEERMG